MKHVKYLLLGILGIIVAPLVAFLYFPLVMLHESGRCMHMEYERWKSKK